MEENFMIDVIIPTCKPRLEVSPLIDEICRTAGERVCIFATCLDASAAHNRNVGLALSTSDVKIMLDDDITGFPQGWVSRMAEVMAAYKNCVMLTPELLNPDGTDGPMAGGPPRGGSGVAIVPSRKLLTACIAIRKNDARFDERFMGSGFEDDDYSIQLRQIYPNGVWMIDHEIRVIHKNEMKQQGIHFDANRRRLEEKWGIKW